MTTHPGLRVLDRVDTSDPTVCWVFPGALSVDGYGNVNSSRWPEVSAKAHRAVYQYLHGEIPAGMTVDHTCHSESDCIAGDECPHRACVNPAHLEVVTRAENMRRSAGRKTSCPHGHVYDEANTYINKKGRKVCRTCRNLAAPRYKR